MFTRKQCILCPALCHGCLTLLYVTSIQDFFLPLEQSCMALLGCRLVASGLRKAARWQLDFSFFCLMASMRTILKSDQLHAVTNTSLQNPTHWNVLPVNAKFSVNQMSPIICRWKLLKHLDCFGDNRRTEDIRNIKLSSLKACCLTLLSYSISHYFPALKLWNEKFKEKLTKSQ